MVLLDVFILMADFLPTGVQEWDGDDSPFQR